MRSLIRKKLARPTYKQQVFMRFGMTASYFALLIGVILLYLLFRQAQAQIDYNKQVKVDTTRQNFDRRADLAINKIEEYKSYDCFSEFVERSLDYRTIMQVKNVLERPLSFTIDPSVWITVTKLTDDMVVTPQLTMTKQQFSERVGLSLDVLNSHNSSNKYELYSTQNINGERYIIVKCNETLPLTNAEIIFFAVIGEYSFVPKITNGESWQLIDQTQTLVLSSNNTVDAPYLREVLFTKMVQTTETANKVYSFALDDHYVMAAISDIYYFKNLSFVMLEKRWVLAKAFELFIIGFPAIVFILFLIGAYFALRSARIVYEPIVQLKNMFASMSTTPSSETVYEDEWTYIQDKAAEVTTYMRMRNEGQPSTGTGGYVYFPIEDEKRLISYVINNNSEDTRRLLTNILKENFQAQEFDASIGWKLIFSLVNTMNRILQIMQISQTELFGEGFEVHLELKMAKSTEEFTEKVLKLFGAIIKRVGEKSSESSGAVAQKLLCFVNDNYDKDISLTDIATQFNMSVGYVSVLFKKVTGQNFKEYLDLKRVDVAKQIMLGRESVKIKDVSDKVGCNNVNTFIRLFKRYEGISPGEFIKNNGVDKE